MTAIEPQSTPLFHGSRTQRGVSWLPLLTKRVNFGAILVFLLLILAWELASRNLSTFMFPSIGTIFRHLISMDIGKILTVAGTTIARITLSLLVTFLVASAFAVFATIYSSIDRAVSPAIQLTQSIPAVCWMIFAILWFDGNETRIVFIVVVTTFPSIYFQMRDAVRAISVDLWEMVQALRPSRYQMFGKLLLPALVPAILTVMQINIGTGTRVAVMTELLSGYSGIGYELRIAQETFRIDIAVAWTIVLVVFVLAADALLGLLSNRLLRWRRASERSL